MTTMQMDGRASEECGPQPEAGDDQTGFGSILFRDPRMAVADHPPPDCFADLHLDQIVAAATGGREEYELAGFYHQLLQDPADVRYRQDVLADLEQREVRDAVTEFAERMRTMRRQHGVARRTRHGLQRRRWLLEAAIVYCDAARALAQALDGAALESEGLTALAAHLGALVDSAAFGRLASEARAVHVEVSVLEYTITIKGAHVQVDAYADQVELYPVVEATFARFAQGVVGAYRWRVKELAGLNHVEEQVLDRVARLFPQPFTRLREFCETHAWALDAPLLRFDREVQFYLGYLEFIEPLQRSGLAFSPAQLHAGPSTVAEAGFDLSLAAKLAVEKRLPVVNDFRLEDPERILVVTGPNQGGKTTFARMLGQLHYLAGLGLPVPARRASLALADRVFTHFEREESLETLRGKFEDELVRIHAILESATPRSVLVMNESFGSTTLADGLLVGSEIVRQIIETGSVCVFVSFIDELAALGPETVSMMSTVVPDDPARRTFAIQRRPADGLAYAAALAAKYELGYDALRRRVGS